MKKFVKVSAFAVILSLSFYMFSVTPLTDSETDPSTLVLSTLMQATADGEGGEPNGKDGQCEWCSSGVVKISCSGAGYNCVDVSCTTGLC